MLVQTDIQPIAAPASAPCGATHRVHVRLLRVLAFVAIALGVVVATLTTADLVHLVHASLLLALGIGALLGRPRAR